MIRLPALRSPLSMVVAVLAASGCEGPTTEMPAFAVRDSAGIEIVESASPALGAGAWTVDPEPVLEIGAVEADAPYVFTRVWDATRLPDGRLVVVDEMTMEIRVFDAAGLHLGTFGGSGDGPAEFGGPAFVEAAADGTIMAWDGGHQRLSRFTLDGRLEHQVSLREPLSEYGVMAFRNGRVWEIDAEGRLLSFGPTRPQRVDGMRDSFRRVVLVDDDGALHHDFGTFPLGQSFVVRLEQMSIGIGNPFSAGTNVALDPDGRVAIGSGGAWAVHLYEPTGEPTRIIRARIARVPVTPELEAAGLEGARQMAETSPLTVRQAENAYAEISLPDSVPAVGLMRASGENLWVGRRTGWWYEVGDYDVFGADGQWLTTVALPDGIEWILEIGSDYLLAHVQDELEVSYMRMYAIRK